MRGSSGLTAKKHKIEYDLHWKEFPWHIPVYREDGNLESGVIGLLCSICQRHGWKQHNLVGIGTDKPCTYMKSDILQRHKRSKIHHGS